MIAAALDLLGGADPGDPARRRGVLRALLDLVQGSGIDPGDARIDAVDTVLTRLADGADAADRAALAVRLADGGPAPPRLLDRLARDEDADVAGPLLAGCPGVPEETLVAVASQRGDGHMIRIAVRPVLGEPVTDVIVERGGPEVLAVVAENAGARFSDFGFIRLAARAGESVRLAIAAARRADLPRRLFPRVLAAAPAEAREALARLGVRSAAGDPLRAGRIDYGEAVQSVDRMARTGRLDEEALAGFARSGEAAHAVAALARMAGMPLEKAEGLVTGPRPEGLLMIARALSLGWPTVLELLSLRPGGSGDPVALRANWERMNPETARAALLVGQRAVRS